MKKQLVGRVSVAAVPLASVQRPVLIGWLKPLAWRARSSCVVTALPVLCPFQTAIMSSSLSVRSFSGSRHLSFSSRSLMDTSRGRPRASVSFAAAGPLGRSASAGHDLNGPVSLQLSGMEATRSNNKEAMQSLNNRLANYLDTVGHVTWSADRGSRRKRSFTFALLSCRCARWSAPTPTWS